MNAVALAIPETNERPHSTATPTTGRQNASFEATLTSFAQTSHEVGATTRVPPALAELSEKSV